MIVVKKLLAIVIVIVFGLLSIGGLWATMSSAYIPFVGMFKAPSAIVEHTAGFFSLWGKALFQLTFTAFMFAPCYAALKYLMAKDKEGKQSSTSSKEFDDRKGKDDESSNSKS